MEKCAENDVIKAESFHHHVHINSRLPVEFSHARTNGSWLTLKPLEATIVIFKITDTRIELCIS